MAAYRTIVVGTDGSSTSFAAVDRAAGIDVLIVHTT
jgi:nucleotide-binding universal stress UspA family protein